MDPTQPKTSAAPSRALWLISCLVGLHAASACGRVRAGGTGSETHWLVSCDSDLDCREGNCECGVCSQTCVTTADCGALGVDSVECVRTAGSCDSGGASGGGSTVAAEDSVCLLPCAQDADCLELGTEATCRQQRCETLPGNTVVGGGSGNESLEIPTLCDGSEDFRVVYARGGGFVHNYYAFFESYGHGFFAIDGQCRFWQGRALDGWVYAGSLSDQEAQAFARALGFGHLSDHGSFQDPGCLDGGRQVLWTQEARLSCLCDCGAGPGVPAGWSAAFGAASTALQTLFASGQLVSGPAQLALLPIEGPPPVEIRGWPLERAPEAREIITTEPRLSGLPPLDESSGALITDPAELSDLRGLRADYSARVGNAVSTPFVWTNPDTLVEERFYMLLRDEVPANVKAALDTARAP